MSTEFKKWILKNSHGVEITVLNLGGAIQKWKIPMNGSTRDIVLGFDDPESYSENEPSFGVLVGRYANRIGAGKFSIGEKNYSLSINNGKNHIHGGTNGFGKQIWSGLQYNDSHVRLTYFSPSGEEGYPGNLDVRVDYQLNDQNEFQIKYWARTDEDTIVNLTNHSYFNLLGHEQGSIGDHLIAIYSRSITMNNEEMIPNGEMQELSGLDQGKSVHQLIEQHFRQNGGIDDNFVLFTEPSGGLNRACALESPGRDLKVEIFTTEPAMQLFTANFQDLKFQGKDGAVYGHHSGVALETQHYPDSPNRPEFPNTVLKAGQVFNSKTLYKLTF